MNALMWVGGILIVLALLGWLVFKIAVKVALFLLIAGVVLIVWSVVTVEQAL